MNILSIWREQLTVKSLRTIGSRWWTNTREFFRILVHDWWWLIITTIAGHLLIIAPLVNIISTDRQLTMILPLPQSGLATEGIILFTCLAFGILSAAVLLIAHSTELVQKRTYYRSHIPFFMIITFITGSIYSIFMFSVAIRGDSHLAPSMFMAIEQLYFFFACFFVLDARPSMGGYFRAITIRPLRLLISQLPIILCLWFILGVITLASCSTLLLPQVTGSFILKPLFLVLCGVVYKLAIDKNREEF